jgi:hypothetical protein
VPKPQKQTQAVDPDALGDIISTLSRLRASVDAANLPDGEARQDLVTHLALASIAAHRFRLKCDDDIIIVDDD